MKNLRKVLALVLAVVMAVSTFTVAFAAEEKTDGQILKALGLIQGNENGDLMEDKTITRAEAARVIVKVMNWELEAKEAYTFVDNTWAKAEAATLAKHGITDGVGDNKFGGDQVMDQLQVYAWAYRAITGDTSNAWANPTLLTAILNADQVTAVVAAKDKPAKRSEIFKGMITILTTEVEGETQLDKLIEAGKVDEKVAIELELKEAPVVENVLLTSELLNYKEVKVVFSVEASAKVDDYKFTFGAQKDVKATKVTVNSTNKKEAIILLPFDNVAGQDEVKFTFGDGSQVKDKAMSIIDATAPVVVDIETTDAGELTVYFSEAIKGGVEVTVDNGMLYAQTPVISTDRRSATVAVASMVDGTAYDIKVSGAKDYAGLKIADKTFEDYIYAKKVAPVEVSVEKASTDQIVLKLSTSVVLKSFVGKESNFVYVLNETPVSVTPGEDNTLVLDLSGYKLPEGNFRLTIKKAQEMFVDSWGNKPVVDTITLDYAVVLDKVAPTVKATFNDTQTELTLKFSEKVTGVVASAIKFYGADTKEITTTNIALDVAKTAAKTAGDEYIFTVNKDAFKTETIKLEIAGDVIKDTANNALAKTEIGLATKYLKTLSAKVEVVKDATDNTLTKKLYVKFENKMPASTADTAKWVIKGTTVTAVEFDGASTTDLVITLKEAVAIATLEITTSAITDVDGNKLHKEAFSYTFNAASLKFADEIKTIEDVTTLNAHAKATQSVDLVFDGNVAGGISTNAFGLYSANALNASATTTKVSAVNNVKYDATTNKTTITVSLPAEFALNAKAVDMGGTATGTSVRVRTTGLVLNSGVALKSNDVEIVDKINPTATAITANATSTNTVVIAVNEALKVTDNSGNNNEVLFGTELVVTVGDKTLTAGIDFIVDEIRTGDTTITLSITKGLAEDDNVTVKLAANSKYITDVLDNALNAFTLTDKAE